MAESEGGSACEASKLSRVEESGEDHLIALGLVVLEVFGRMGVLFGEKTHMSIEGSTKEQSLST